jgi:hypothetical protein
MAQSAHSLLDLTSGSQEAETIWVMTDGAVASVGSHRVKFECRYLESIGSNGRRAFFVDVVGRKHRAISQTVGTFLRGYRHAG